MTASIPEDKIPEVTGPIARFADPSEMATAVAFLVSEEAGRLHHRCRLAGRRRSFDLKTEGS